MGKRPLAVLIDGENVAASHLPAIMHRARELGEPMARCVVGDFSTNRLSEWADLAPEYAFETIFQKSGGKGRNSADIALTIRAMDLLAENNFKIFLLVSSDCDFAPLAVRLGRSGIAVYGMGKAKSDSAWRAACTEFFELGMKEAPAVANARPTPVKKPATVAKPAFSKQDGEAVRKIINKRTSADSPWIKLSQLGQHVREESKDLGARLGNGRLLKSLRTDALVESRGKGQGIEVRLKASGQPKQSPARPTAPVPSPAAVHQPA